MLFRKEWISHVFQLSFRSYCFKCIASPFLSLFLVTLEISFLAILASQWYHVEFYRLNFFKYLFWSFSYALDLSLDISDNKELVLNEKSDKARFSEVWRSPKSCNCLLCRRAPCMQNITKTRLKIAA